MATYPPPSPAGSHRESERPFRLGIVIPVQARVSARSWENVEARLRDTVTSLCRQSSANWDALIVGHDLPDIGRDAPGVSVITIDTPPPAADADRAARREDMVAKRDFGMRLLSARERTTHWLRFDADDLLEDRFVATIESMLPFDIAVVRRGFAYYPSRGRFRRLDHIDRTCGSTVITSDRWWADPTAPAGRRYVRMNHRAVDAEAARRGIAVRDYPHRGVAYTLGHGDNLYRTLPRRIRVWIESRLLSRPCDEEFRERFGVPGLP